MSRQKEQLKKDILKKRAVLEKELQTEIRKELATELVQRSKQIELGAVPQCKDSEDDTSTHTTPTSSPIKKRYASQ